MGACLVLHIGQSSFNLFKSQKLELSQNIYSSVVQIENIIQMSTENDTYNIHLSLLNHSIIWV